MPRSDRIADPNSKEENKTLHSSMHDSFNGKLVVAFHFTFFDPISLNLK